MSRMCPECGRGLHRGSPVCSGCGWEAPQLVEPLRPSPMHSRLCKAGCGRPGIYAHGGRDFWCAECDPFLAPRTDCPAPAGVFARLRQQIRPRVVDVEAQAEREAIMGEGTR